MIFGFSKENIFNTIIIFQKVKNFSKKIVFNKNSWVNQEDYEFFKIIRLLWRIEFKWLRKCSLMVKALACHVEHAGSNPVFFEILQGILISYTNLTHFNDLNPFNLHLGDN